MVVLGLDIATKTGFGVLKDGKLILHGLMPKPEIQSNPDEIEDLRLIKLACKVADNLLELIKKVNPDFITVEQTNQGKFRDAQKQLEFIHAAFLIKLIEHGLSEKVNYVDTSKWRSVLEVKLSKEQRLHNKAVKDGKKRGKITPKHLAVQWANSSYSLELLKKDHDIADAIALATFGFKEKSKPKIDTTHNLEEIFKK